MVMLGINKYPAPSPVRQSTRKTSGTTNPSQNGTSSTNRGLPTPLTNGTNNSPTKPTPSPSTLRYPPTFDPSLHHTSTRYSAGQYTPFSPYRPGEYGRSGGLGLTNGRSKVERRLFGEDSEDEDGKGRNRGSSPLQPAFQAKMVLRKGAPVDLISWLRKNFHHVPPAQPPSTPAPSMSLLAIRTLLSERFPRVPEQEELVKAVVAAFPRSSLDYPSPSSSEPPIIRGLVWHGIDLHETTTSSTIVTRPRTPEKPQPQIITRSTAKGGVTKPNGFATSQQQISTSPSQSTLVSPISAETSRKIQPNTPARSVLEEFAEIATLADKTPVSQTRSLPAEIVPPAPAYALANICNSTDRTPAIGQLLVGINGTTLRKRRASQSPDGSASRRRARAKTPDKLQGLLAAAAAVEGSPITHLLGHKRRRTIGGATGFHDVFDLPSRFANKDSWKSQNGLNMLNGHGRKGINGFGQEGGLGAIHGEDDDEEDDRHSMSEAEAEEAIQHSPYQPSRAHTDSTASQKSISAVSANIPSISASSTMSDLAAASQSHGNGNSNEYVGSSKILNGNGNLNANNNGPIGTGPSMRLAPRQRKANELPTEGDHPGVDCKPPYPYHELIRHAIESAPDNRLQLSQIYVSIAERFPFFKTLDEKKTAGWQNSIRHNLSLKKMFVRVNKEDTQPGDEAGKGGWWTVQPGVPDEGRPGRKAKGSGSGSVSGSVTGAELAMGMGSKRRNGQSSTPLGGGGSIASLPGSAPGSTMGFEDDPIHTNNNDNKNRIGSIWNAPVSAEEEKIRLGQKWTLEANGKSVGLGLGLGLAVEVGVGVGGIDYQAQARPTS